MLKIEKFKKINDMTDFANLFLAIYSKNKITDENEENLYIDKHFNDIFDDVISNYEFGNYNLLDEFGLFNITKFRESLKISKVRECWAEDLKYDLQKDCIFFKVNKKNMQEVIEKYDAEDINLVEKIALEVISKEKEYTCIQAEEIERKYTCLYKRSDD